MIALPPTYTDSSWLLIHTAPSATNGYCILHCSDLLGKCIADRYWKQDVSCIFLVVAAFVLFVRNHERNHLFHLHRRLVLRRRNG
ncbi:hypothetical protein TNIN_399701 [Trichonephila inaurata madagascariensis]|uniref:Uncharacterized protein n=1 Tax=Trichonephila inaurata madagascariensis TaxID=2747483 RepID=A0A8X6XIT8_9ARAC|nr:hypothetical protein TNIN_399701 [Trichonephila inaurata madagascariensis]